MKAQIVKISDLKKTLAEREAEELLTKLQGQDEAILVSLQASETPRRIGRIFRKAAKAVGKEVGVRRKENQLIVRLKEPKVTGITGPSAQT